MVKQFKLTDFIISYPVNKYVQRCLTHKTQLSCSHFMPSHAIQHMLKRQESRVITFWSSQHRSLGRPCWCAGYIYQHSPYPIKSYINSRFGDVAIKTMAPFIININLTLYFQWWFSVASKKIRKFLSNVSRSRLLLHELRLSCCCPAASVSVAASGLRVSSDGMMGGLNCWCSPKIPSGCCNHQTHRIHVWYIW